MADFFSSMRVSATGLDAQMKRMNTISSNIANSETVGYKRKDAEFTATADRESFGEILNDKVDQAVQGGAAAAGKGLEPLVHVIRQADGECAHGNRARNWSGLRLARSGKSRAGRERSRMLRVTMAAAPPAIASSTRWLSPSSGRLGRQP